MKKVLLIGFASIVVLLIIGILNMGTLMKGAINNFGSRFTGTDVTLSEMDISFLSGKAEAKDFSLGNPEGFKAKDALKVSSIYFDLEERSLTTNVIVVEKIEVIEPVITFERGKDTDNLKKILENIRAFVGEGEEQESSEKELERKILIRDFYVKSGKVHISIPGLSSEVIQANLPDIHLEDIGGMKEGAPPAEVFEKILAAIYAKIASPEKGESMDIKLERLKSEADDLNKSAKKELKNIEGSVKNFLEGMAP